MAEKNTDALLDSKPKKTEMKNNKEDVEETVHKSGLLKRKSCKFRLL